MQKAISIHKTISRLVIEMIIVTGSLSVIIGILQKFLHLGNIYAPHWIGFTPKDFIEFGGIAFLLAVAIASRRILKHLEFLAEKK